MKEFAMENPLVTLFIVLALLATIRAVVPWVRRSRDDVDVDDED
jgi:hypothetical protein